MAKPSKIHALLAQVADEITKLSGGKAAPAEVEVDETEDTEAEVEETEAEEETETEEEETEESEEGADYPSADEIEELDKDALNELAGNINIEVKGKKLSEIRAILLTVRKIIDDDDSITKEEANAVALAAGVAPSKKVEATIEALKEFLSDDEDEDEAETE
jgi:hypothetical protein